MCVLLFSNDKMAKLTIKRLSPEEEFPDLSQHNNHMAKVLTQDMYTKLRDRATPNGFTIDGVIQTGIDNPGKTNPSWVWLHLWSLMKC